jgi:predicted hotdog family 3-hydroxylacyl-ACP dehydratase
MIASQVNGKDGDPTTTSPVLVRIDKNTDSTVRARVNVDPNERHPLLVEMS